MINKGTGAAAGPAAPAAPGAAAAPGAPAAPGTPGAQQPGVTAAQGTQLQQRLTTLEEKVDKMMKHFGVKWSRGED